MKISKVLKLKDMTRAFKVKVGWPCFGRDRGPAGLKYVQNSFQGTSKGGKKQLLDRGGMMWEKLG